MASPKAKLQKLIDARDQLRIEAEAIRNKMLGVEMAIAMLEAADDADPTEAKPERARRGNVKAALLDFLKEVGRTGLNAATTLDIATKRGLDLDRGTVSSLLSRLKADGIVDYDGDRYRLKEAPSERPLVEARATH